MSFNFVFHQGEKDVETYASPDRGRKRAFSIKDFLFNIVGIHLRQLTILSTSSNSFSSLFAE